MNLDRGWVRQEEFPRCAEFSFPPPRSPPSAHRSHCSRSTIHPITTGNRPAIPHSPPPSPPNGGARTRNATSRSEEHTSELQSLMRISYAVFCLKKKNKENTHN